MKNKLFVGNLLYEVTSEELRDFFSQYGALDEAVVITERNTSRSKGYGFIRFKNEKDAAKAAEETNGKDYRGRPLVVNIADAPKKKVTIDSFF